MKASELIDNLRALISKHGDLDVCLADWNEDYREPMEAGSVEYSVVDRRTPAFVINT